MNKLWGNGTKSAVLACVLEPGNIHLLTKERKPIAIDLNDRGREIFWDRIRSLETGIAPKDSSDHHVLGTSFGTFEDRRTPVMEKKVPHCPECKSSVEQLGVWRSDISPLWLVFCATCGCIFGASKPIEGLEKKK